MLGKINDYGVDGESREYQLSRPVGGTDGLDFLNEAAHENEPRLAVPSCHGR